jgi:O-antigen/teichoic acid export membrane protein
MTSNVNSYRYILKAFGLFGGVQIVTILVLLLRSKVVAIHLGPHGIGISTLFNSTLTTITTILGLGISFSAVREIASANSYQESFLLRQTITVFRKWIWFTSLLGVFVIIFFSKQISIWTFGNNSYTYSFIFLSINILLTTYSTQQLTILQGLGKLKKMAKMKIWGSIFGLLTLPLYYFYGLNGIVPSIILSAFLSAVISRYFSTDLNVKSIKIENRQAFILGLNMVKVGILVTISGLFYTFGTYSLNIFIDRLNGPNDVGLYQSGWMITNQAVGLIFTAMSVDYYPRLVSLKEDNNRLNAHVNQQAEIMVLVIGSLIGLLIIFIPLVIRLLLSDKFLSITNFVRLTSLGILFKAVHWCLGYVILAKGSTRLYVINEFLGITIMFLSYVIGYYYFGLDGIGYAFIFSYIIFLLIYYYLLHSIYSFRFNKSLVSIFLFITCSCTLIYFSSLIKNELISGLLKSLLFILLLSFSIKELNNKLLLKDIFYRFVRKTS